MKPVLSVAIPAHNEERYIGRCIERALSSAQRAAATIEVVVALNRCTDRTREVAESLGASCVEEDKRCIAAVRNAAVRASSAPAVATIDADSWMSQNTIAAVVTRVYDRRYAGGGCSIRPERLSLGICFSLLAVMPYVLGRGVSGGMFWFLRDTFDELDGFNDQLLSAEDLDFALRLKALGTKRSQKYGTIWRDGITTSCRKFDAFGDWYLFKHPGLVRRIFTGKDRTAADHFYYDPNR